jgi:hypothetical protein
MKYIKLFNESLNSDNLREFCEVNLAYLLDEYDLKITPIKLSSGVEYQVLEIRTYTRYNQDTHTFSPPIGYFYWNDIKDHVIPFLKRIRKSYTIHQITFDARGYSGSITIKGPSVNALINEQYDRIEYSYALLNKDFTYFSIKISEKL